MRGICALTFAAACLCTGPAFAQECLHGPTETPDQKARRVDALHVARTVNNLEANQPGARTRTYLRQVELKSSPFATRPDGQSEWFRKLNFTPGQDVIPGWALTLDVTQDGYWFAVKDKTDSCGFRYISSQDGLIFTAEPIR
jgi:hypothetical protein